MMERVAKVVSFISNSWMQTSPYYFHHTGLVKGLTTPSFVHEQRRSENVYGEQLLAVFVV